MAALLSSPFITPLYIRPPERTSEVFHQSFYGSFVSSVLNPQIPSSIARYGSKSVRCEVAGEGWRESFDRTMYKGIYGPWTIEPSDVREVVALVSRFWYPLYAKAALCQTCYRALRLNKALEAKAMELLNAIPKPFLSLHLRFEPDMVAYSQCDYPGLSPSSLAAIDSARGDRKPWTGDAAIAWRNRGKCPLTPNETAFILQSLSIPTNTNIYLAAGDGLMEIEGLTSSYTNVYSKSSFLDTKDFVNMHGNTKAALDYYVSINSDGYIATYFGNMDKMVSAMRVLNGMHKTLFLSRRAFANYSEKRLQGEELAEAMWREHLDDFVNGRGFALPDCFCEFKL